MFSSGKILFSSGVESKAKVVFDAQPETKHIGGGSTSLSVSVRTVPPDLPLSYQWYRLPKSLGNGALMIGETSPTLNLSGLTLSANDGDSYRCVVTTMGESFSSSAAEVYFSDPPLQAVFACGLNSQYALGDGTNISRSWLVRTLSAGVISDNFSRPTSGHRHGFVIKNIAPNGGELWGWGSRGYMVGLGDWQSGEVASPVRVGSSLWLDVSAGGDHTIAIRGDGTLWGWGMADVGDGRAPVGNSPTLIDSGSWSKVSAGGDINEGHSLAIKSSAITVPGTLWARGRNAEGQLGLGDNTNRTTFTNIPGDWIHVSAGYRHTMAIKANGTLWGWGENTYGQLGDGTKSNRNSPVLIDGGSWSTVSAGSFNSLAVRSDGTLWGWGLRSGDGTMDAVLSPKIIDTGFWLLPGSLPHWRISAGAYQSAAIKGDGTLWAWGDNFSGALSTGPVSRRILSPTQVSSGNWKSLDCGAGTSSQIIAIR